MSDARASSRRVLLVAPDDEPARALAAGLASGLRVDHRAELRLDGPGYDGLVVALDAARLDGMAILDRFLEHFRHAPAYGLVSPGAEERGLAAMERGAAGYETWPASPRRLLLLFAREAGRQERAARADALEESLAGLFAWDQLIGESRGIARARAALHLAARHADPVLVLGEPGAGREHAARVLHANTPGAAGPFTRAAVETAAQEFARRGGGTVFVPDVDADTPAAAAARAAIFYTVAAPDDGVATRVVAAARAVPADLEAAVAVRVVLPPLREREGDVLLLADHFLREANREHGRRVTGLTRGALAHLEAHDWPGNVRELRSTIEGMVVFAEGRRPLDVSDLPLRLRERATGGGQVSLALDMTLAEAEKRFLEETLRFVGYDRARAAETLGIGLRTLYRKLKEYEIG